MGASLAPGWWGRARAGARLEAGQGQDGTLGWSLASLTGKGTAIFDAGARAHVCVHHC